LKNKPEKIPRIKVNIGVSSSSSIIKNEELTELDALCQHNITWI